MSEISSIQRVEFQDRVRTALNDVNLQRAMAKAKSGFVDKRLEAKSALPEFDQIRDAARDIKDHVLSNLDTYLELYEEKVIENGGHVHWARDAEEVLIDGCLRSSMKRLNYRMSTGLLKSV